MRTGKLRHKVTIRRLTRIENDIGDLVTVWVDIATAWAAIEPVGGKEYWTAAQLQAETTHKVTMRPVPGVRILPADQLYFKDRILEIEAVMDIEERGRELELLCKEKL